MTCCYSVDALLPASGREIRHAPVVDACARHEPATDVRHRAGCQYPLKRSARREFMYQRNLRVTKARVEVASRAVNEQSKRMQEFVKGKERFFWSACHDIQQPPAAINLFILSARTSIREGQAVDRDFDVIEKTAPDILGMFKDIQDYSELGSYIPGLTPVNTRDLLTEVFGQYREPAQLRGIDLRIAERRVHSPTIETDRLLLKRALSNLGLNAIKNTSSGGVVLGWVQLIEWLRLDVRDTGIGIAPARQEAIFAEYYQINNPGRDRSKGRGLGLSIVQRVVRFLSQHAMTFSSVEGCGSRFSLFGFSLPQPNSWIAIYLNTAICTDRTSLGCVNWA
jgi:signal transduction histidine kinase